MKNSALLFFLLFGAALYAQVPEKRFDLRLGAGFSLLGSGDMMVRPIEIEGNYRLNNYFAAGASLGMGRSRNGAYEWASYMQGNANLFFSPFKNSRRVDFRLGVGLTYYDVADLRLYRQTYSNGQEVYSEYIYNQRKSLGFNIIIENTVCISKRFLLGMKAFTQPYNNGDIHSGILLKAGIKL